MGNLLLRLPADLHEQARQAAQQVERSLNSWIIRAIREAIKKATAR